MISSTCAYQALPYIIRFCFTITPGQLKIKQTKGQKHKCILIRKLERLDLANQAVNVKMTSPDKITVTAGVSISCSVCVPFQQVLSHCPVEFEERLHDQD